MNAFRNSFSLKMSLRKRGTAGLSRGEELKKCKKEDVQLKNCEEKDVRLRSEITLNHITLSKPELAKDKPPNSCRYKNCKRCQEESSKSAVFPDDSGNDCNLTNNNETSDCLSNEAINSHSPRTESSKSSDMSHIYDYTDEFDSPEENKAADANSEHTCTLCKVTFKDQIELLRHQRASHQFPKTILTLEQIERYYDYPNRNNCPICKKPIRSNFRSVFIKHLKTHTMAKSAVCRICNMVFKSKSYMRSHEKRHVVQN